MTLLAAEEKGFAESLSPSVADADQSASNALLDLARLAAQVATAASPPSLDAWARPRAGRCGAAENEVGDRITALQVLLGHQRALASAYRRCSAASRPMTRW